MGNSKTQQIYTYIIVMIIAIIKILIITIIYIYTYIYYIYIYEFHSLEPANAVSLNGNAESSSSLLFVCWMQDLSIDPGPFINRNK